MLEVQKDRLRAKLKKGYFARSKMPKREKKKMRVDFQREKVQIATQHQDTVRGEDEKILGLQKAARLEEGRRQTAANHETLLKVKEKEIMGLKQKLQLQDQRTQSATEHERVVREKDEEISGSGCRFFLAMRTFTAFIILPTDTSSIVVVGCLFVQVFSVWWGTRNEKNARSAAYWAKVRRGDTNDDSKLAWGVSLCMHRGRDCIRSKRSNPKNCRIGES